MLVDMTANTSFDIKNVLDTSQRFGERDERGADAASEYVASYISIIKSIIECCACFRYPLSLSVLFVAYPRVSWCHQLSLLDGHGILTHATIILMMQGLTMIKFVTWICGICDIAITTVFQNVCPCATSLGPGDFVISWLVANCVCAENVWKLKSNYIRAKVFNLNTDFCGQENGGKTRFPPFKLAYMYNCDETLNNAYGGDYDVFC